MNSATGTTRLGVYLGLSLQLGLAGVALAGGAQVVLQLFPAVAVAVAAWLLVTRRHVAYVEFVLWLWLLAPGLRRVVDLGVGWTPVSPIMLAAPVATLLSIGPALMGRRKIDPAVSAALSICLATVAYGLAVGVVIVGGLGAPLASALSWLPPLVFGLYVAVSGPVSNGDLVAVVRRTALLGSLLLGSYGVLQFVAPPDWDLYWLQNAPIDSAGYPEPFEVRVWSTMNSPPPFASVLGVLLILLLGSRGASRWPSMLAGFVSFGLSLVRTAWLGYVIALGTLLSPGRTRLLRSAVLGIGLPVLVLLIYGGPVASVITDRFSATTSNGTQDKSFSDRQSFYSTQLPLALTNPVGRGLGSVGVATKLTNGGNLGAEGNFDGGALEVVYTFGMPVGLAFLGAAGLAVSASWRAARRRGDLEKAMAAALVGLVTQLPLANPLTTPSGIFFWLLVGVLARPAAAEEATAVAAVTRPSATSGTSPGRSGSRRVRRGIPAGSATR